MVASSCLASCVRATTPTLADVCTAAYVKAHLPAANFYSGIALNASSVTATAVYNASSAGSYFFPTETFDYCSVELTYSHTGLGDEVVLTFWLPAPADFKNRYLATGGGGYAINSQLASLPGGVIYGAVAGQTDGGFGADQTNAIDTFLVSTGVRNNHSITMFGYQAIHELSVVGKAFTQTFYSMGNTKLYSYYQACSEGGREGWSQIQRYGDQWDGAVVGAPAFRFSFQQVQHLYSDVVEQTLGYYPPPCELAAIVNATLKACDGLDGRVDGVVSRTDLCSLHYNISSTLGLEYYCAPQPALQFPPTPAFPEQSGSVTAEGIKVAQQILNGLHDSKGNRVYFSYQPTAPFTDAQTAYNDTTDTWGQSISFLGGGYVEVLLDLIQGATITSLANVTYDTLKEWIWQGWTEYNDVLQTDNPVLIPFHAAGGKVIHIHGESDDSVPTASSVRYWESVRQVMYPGQSYQAGAASLNEWYRLFLIPGAAHCSPSALAPNGPFPQHTLEQLIDWVESDIEPTTLTGTVLLGDQSTQQICSWPLRPLWSNQGTTLSCVYDQTSINTWQYDINAFFPVPVF
ncbi:tannase [Xylariales sp. PMI_506]|nr:tannase [Xylariales sp. PMI_506]